MYIQKYQYKIYTLIHTHIYICIPAACTGSTMCSRAFFPSVAIVPAYIDGTQSVLPASLPRKVMGISSQPLRPVPLLHILQSCPQTRMPAKPLQRPLQAVHLTMLLHVDQASSLIAPASSSSLGWCIPEPVPSSPHITPPVQVGVQLISGPFHCSCRPPASSMLELWWRLPFISSRSSSFAGCGSSNWWWWSSRGAWHCRWRCLAWSCNFSSTAMVASRCCFWLWQKSRPWRTPSKRPW